MSQEQLFPPPRVLVVEAEPLLLEALLGLLRAEGYTSSGVGSLEEALAVVEETSFALIVADLFAGKSRHSFTPAHMLRRRTQSIPIGIFTEEDISRWDERRSLFAFLLTKPIHPTQLLTEVAACLSRPPSSAQARQAEVVQRFFEALSARRWNSLLKLCIQNVKYAVPTALLGVPGTVLEGKQALTVFASSVWQSVPGLRLEVSAIYSRPRGLAVRYLRAAPTPEQGWAWQEHTQLFAFVGDQISLIGLADLQPLIPQGMPFPQVG